MVSNKKIPTISPIAATQQQNQMLESDGGVNKSANWMREQWVANLKKKSLENGASFSGPAVRQLAPGGSSNRATKANARGANRRVATNHRQQQQQQQQQLLLQQHQQQQMLQQQQQLQLQQQLLHQNNLQLQQQQHYGQQQQQQQHISIAPMVGDCHAYTDKDLSTGSLYFNDLGGCFEIESQSFTPLTPTAGGFDFLLPSPSTPFMAHSFDAAPTATATVTTALSTGSPSTSRVGSVTTEAAGMDTNPLCKVVSSPSCGDDATKAKTMRTKPLLKKRTNVLALEVDQPKPRTPRRKLNCGNAFEDVGEVQSPPSSASASTSSTPTSTTTQFYTSVGTPSNFNAELSNMWGGPDLDFNSASFVNTFLDLPTPKSAAILAMHSLPTQASSAQVTQKSTPSPPLKQTQERQPLPTPQLESQPTDDADSNTMDDDLVQPKLIRTSSIEQDGLSQFLRRTSLNSMNASGSENGGSPLLPSRHMPTHHHQIKKNQIDLSEPYSQAAHGAVDECFSKLHPVARRNSLLLPSQFLGGISSGFARPLASTTTPRSVMVRGPNGEYKLEQHKNMPEFETLLDEYQFTDADNELDTFYLDTIESIGGDLDRISN